MTAFGFSGLLAGISALGFGLFVLLKSPDRRIAKIWFAFSLSVAVWGFGALGIGCAKTPHAAWLAWGFGYTCGVIWIASLFYHFVCVFLGLKKAKAIGLNYAISSFFLIAYPSRLFFKRLDFMWNSIYFTQSGPLHYLFFVWWISLVIYSHVLMIQRYPHVSPIKKDQIKYFFLAMFSAFSVGSITFLNNFGFTFYPWSHFGVFLYPIIMSYAIVKHRMMDINIVLRKTLIYSVVSATLAATYVGTITLLAHIFEGRHASVSGVSSAFAAIVMTLMFNPVRVRTQRWIDRRFPRERLDPELLQEAAGGFAHEMKRPLAKISLPAELALMDLEQIEGGEKSFAETLPTLKERLRFIIDQSQDAGRMIEAVRAISTSAGAPRTAADPRDILNGALATEKKHLQKQGITVSLTLPDAPPAVYWQARQIEIVLVNLIKNAADAMEHLPAGHARDLHIRMDVESTAVIVRIKDSGSGIHSADAKRIFQPTFTTKGIQGTGMGLYLSRQIIEAHRGTLNLLAPDAQGAEFILRLPIQPFL